MSDKQTLEQRIAALEHTIAKMTKHQQKACQLIHDLRTPLLTIHNGLNAQINYAEQLIAGYQLACQHQLIEKPLRKQTRAALATSLATLLPEVKSCNTELDKVLKLIHAKDK